MSELVACAFLVLGTTFISVSALGLLRMPDVYSRLHAVTKSSTLGMAGVLTASAVHFGSQGTNVWAEILTLAFVFLTTPVGGHMIGRSAYLCGVRMTQLSVVDQLQKAGERGGAAHDTE